MLDDTPPPEVADFFKGLDKQLGSPIPKSMPDDDPKPDDKPKPNDDPKPDDKLKPDDEPPLTFEPKQRAKPTKDESVAVLRKQRDEAIQASKTFNELFKDQKPESIKPIFDFLVKLLTQHTSLNSY
jgi:hypothetical protein